MNVASYLFQSPSPNPVQVGRLDPGSVEKSTPQTDASLPNTTLDKAESFQASQTTDVKPQVKAETQHLLDVYA